MISFFIVKERNRRHFWDKYYYSPLKKREEKSIQIKLSPKLDWSSLYDQYLRMDIDKLYPVYHEEFLQSDILHDENDWFYLTYLCILLYKKQYKTAEKVLIAYVSGVNGLKHIEQFLPVADLAEKMGYTNERILKAALVFRALEKRKTKFQKFIRGKTVALVGNGPSELGKGKGSEIDAHDIVIRMNNYQTKGHETDYGSKTDVWVRGWGGDDLLDYTSKNKYLFAGVSGNYYFIPLYYDFQLDILYRDLIERKIETGYISCDLYAELRQTVDIHPSTGFAILYNLLRSKCQKINLYGFSFLQEKSDGYATHYFNDRDENEARVRSSCHSWDKESEWIRLFMSNDSLLANISNKITYLNPHFYKVRNIGDLVSTPVQYFNSLLHFREVDIWDMSVNGYKFLKPRDIVLFGGGILNEIDFEKFFKKSICKKIAWGIGLFQSQKYEYLFSAFDLIGLRDFNRPEIDNKKVFYVPCASCMSQLFDNKHEQKYRICFYAHKLKTPADIIEKFKEKNIPILDNETPFEEVIPFLAQSEYVITNSYHGTYWATLLGKKVLCVPFNDKFYGFKYAPTYTTFDTYETDMDKAVSYPEALNESREINLSFYEKVIKLIHN